MNQTSDSPALEFSPVGDKSIHASFDGGNISSDGGLVLLKEVEQRLGVIKAMESCIQDQRDQRYTDHSYQTLLTQRVFQICAGYEDADDCDSLRTDPILKICADRLPDTDPSLASQPTMSRFENIPTRSMLYRMAYTFVDLFLDSYEKQPSCIILDFDDTEDITHGSQQYALFNAYVNEYCFMPLHIYEGFSGKLVSTILKPGARLSGEKTLAIVRRLVAHVRTRWKNTLILFRADSHFESPEVMEWIDTQERLYFLTGLASNTVLKKLAESTVQTAQKLFSERQSKVTLFHSFSYQARSWAKARRVIVKVEISPDHADPNVRFIVTNADGVKASVLYEKLYCARGKAELYIKDHKTYLKSDRTSCHRFLANQFRLFLHSAAYVLIDGLRRNLLGTTEWKNATMQTIQLRLLKIGSRIKELRTRIKIEFPTACPAQETIHQAYRNLQQMRC